MLKVSVIVPAYNSELYLAEALDSVIAQTFTDWECIIVDDGSTDGTLAVAQSYSTKDSRIKVFHQANQGPSVARNNAIAHSTGEYIVPVDADDKIAPTYFEEALSWFHQHPETTLVYGLVQLFGDVNYLCEMDEYKYENFIWYNSIISSAMFRRKDFDKTKGYDPNMKLGYEDWDLWLSILNSNSIVHRIEKVLYFYRQHSVSRNRLADEKQEILYRQLYSNHKEVYAPYIADIISLKRETDSLKRQYDYNNHILSTKAYKIGKILLTPFRLLSRK